MRLGRRLATGVAEHPPAPAPQRPEAPERTERAEAAGGAVDAPRPAEPVPAELAADR